MTNVTSPETPDTNSSHPNVAGASEDFETKKIDLDGADGAKVQPEQPNPYAARMGVPPQQPPFTPQPGPQPYPQQMGGFPPYGQQPPAPYPGYAAVPPQGTAPMGAPLGAPAPVGHKGFWASLFDFSFSTFITVKFARIIYILAVVVNLIAAIAIFVSMWGTSYYFDGWLFFFGLVLGIVYFLLSIIFSRLGLEFVVAMIKTAENTHAMNVALAQERHR